MADENKNIIYLGALGPDGAAANRNVIYFGALGPEAAAEGSMLMMMAANKRGNKLTHRGRKQ